MRAKGAGAESVDSARADVVVANGDAAPWASVCLNCAGPLSGPFCSRCGQRALPPHPTVRELAGDAYNELIGWDGRFARTVRLLLTRPGELTVLLLEGQRARFVSPVRLYLVCSVAFFVLAAVPVPVVIAQSGGEGPAVGAARQTPGQLALGKALRQGEGALTPAERAALEREVASLPAILRPIVRATARDRRGLQQRVSEMMPRALFVLIPLLAALLSLVHRRRPYPDHLYFALHVQAFAFVMLSAAVLFQVAGSARLITTGRIGAVLAILVYAVVAQHRVYGGSWLLTVLKTAGVATLYIGLWGIASVAITLWASR